MLMRLPLCLKCGESEHTRKDCPSNKRTYVTAGAATTRAQQAHGIPNDLFICLFVCLLFNNASTLMGH